MIRAEFFKDREVLRGFSVTGHAGYGARGFDIVCAGVSSAVQMAANGLTEIIKAPALVECKDNLVSLRLDMDSIDISGIFMLEALRLQLSLLAESYPESIKIIITEER
ncbi:MAG: ribosomal-processing cysteine protease Prp [Oscillospiraceae bacterium]|jgi:uncharacterized protein YsxB (DUF464 family)|nr:ribosomal-processing cysteine protease Prp [Oscillospiraceae bacterium]